jgi:hypothetical protein
MKVTFVSRSIIVFTLNLCAIAAPVVSQADTLYTSGAGYIYKYDSSGVPTVVTNYSGDPGRFIVDGLAFDKAGNLYAADQSGTPAILKFNSSGVSTVFATVGGPGPGGIAFDSAGNLYEAQGANNTVEKFDSSGTRTVFAGGLNDPSDLAIDSSNNLYVSGQNGFGQNTILKITPLGVVTGFGTLTPGGPSFPIGLAFDSAGNLYAANAGNRTIEKFNASGVGTVFASILSPTGWPSGLAFDSSGNLYVCVIGEGIEKFNSSGVGTVFENTSAGEFLAFEPVPEPSTCELLAFGLIGLLAARGRGGRALERR